MGRKEEEETTRARFSGQRSRQERFSQPLSFSDWLSRKHSGLNWLEVDALRKTIERVRFFALRKGIQKKRTRLARPLSVIGSSQRRSKDTEREANVDSSEWGKNSETSSASG